MERIETITKEEMITRISKRNGDYRVTTLVCALGIHLRHSFG